MKLSAWARQQGLSYKTAWRVWKAGQLPVPAEQLATGTVIVHAAPAHGPPVWRYTPEFPPGPESGLGSATGPFGGVLRPARLSGAEAVRETGSGWNGRRKALRNPNVQVIVVEHCDRLMRLG